MLNIKKLTINTPKRYRLVKQIVDTRVFIGSLNSLVKCGNVYEEVRQLRLKGWEIITIQEPNIDTDNRKGSLGYYQLDPCQKQQAHEAIAEYEKKHEANS